MAVESIVNLTAGKISELLVQEAKLLYGVKDEVESMQDELIMMNSFLHDMEALDEEGVDERTRNTAKQIRRISYDAEDVIDTYILNAARNKNDPFKRYLCFCERLINTHKAGADIQGITNRIARTMEMLRKYGGENGLTRVVGEGALNNPKVWRPAVYAHSNEDYVVGIQEDINKLVKSLTANENQMQVLSIVGMGGCGKTTLVRKIYNHQSVKQCFECRAWVPISQQWVAQQGLLDIFTRISENTKQLDEARGPQAAGEKIFEFLEKKKYLIVLDDVWTKQALGEILQALPRVNNGSKIIVTTRFRDVADDIPASKKSIHEPRELTAEESWELFEKIADLNREDPEFDALKRLGKEMLRKCKGLPLAVVALAGILAKKKTLEDWEKVNQAMRSTVMETGRGTQAYGAVNAMLTLSYNDLPRDLKPCFLYLGLFPEDCRIPAGMLIRMWIAEGFISSNNLHQGETLEDLGRKYLDELIGRCVVRVAARNYDGRAKRIEIHDLMRELCINKAKELDFLDTLYVGSSDSANARVLTQPRRTAVHSYNDKVFFPFSTENPHLRSLFLFATPTVGSLYDNVREERTSELSLQPILKNYKLLRVLNLVCINTSDGTLPNEIGTLIHLRYFGLRVTNIRELPSSIGNLRNLLTLDYRRVVDNESDFISAVIPKNVVWEIEGIRHIYLPLYRASEGMRFDTLQHLQTLCVGGGSWMLDELPKLSTSVRKLHIEGIESNEELEAVFRCPSIMSDRLHKLTLYWNYDSGETVLRNLEVIVNSQHLRKLVLYGRIDDRSACFQFPFGIKRLYLEDAKLEAEATLEALGRLPNLQVLTLMTDSYIGTKWTCYEGMFSQLKFLWIKELPNLEEWTIERGAMCQLKELGIFGCKRFRRIPEGLKFITTLKELYFMDMTEEFHSKIREENGEDYHIIQHIPLVRRFD